jgi:hypothetical protein
VAAYRRTCCKRWVNCWVTQVATLHRGHGDGSHIRPLSSNNEQDNTPWPLPDGRILYTRRLQGTSVTPCPVFAPRLLTILMLAGVPDWNSTCSE